jgi:hypothetical protein
MLRRYSVVKERGQAQKWLLPISNMRGRGKTVAGGYVVEFEGRMILENW